MGPTLASAPRRAVLLYDEECARCRANALWLMRLALRAGALEIIPCRSSVRRERFPRVADDACVSGMRLVLPDGRVLTGADAVPDILRRIGTLRWLPALLDLPGLRALSPRLYGRLARTRVRVTCGPAARAT